MVWLIALFVALYTTIRNVVRIVDIFTNEIEHIRVYKGSIATVRYVY